jgi:hypothetical protein
MAKADWQYRKAKKKLKKQLLDPKSIIHNMTADDVWNSNPEYKQYPLFPSYKVRFIVALLFLGAKPQDSNQ